MCMTENVMRIESELCVCVFERDGLIVKRETDGERDRECKRIESEWENVCVCV